MIWFHLGDCGMVFCAIVFDKRASVIWSLAKGPW